MRNFPCGYMYCVREIITFFLAVFPVKIKNEMNKKKKKKLTLATHNGFAGALCCSFIYILLKKEYSPFRNFLEHRVNNRMGLLVQVKAGGHLSTSSCRHYSKALPVYLLSCHPIIILVIDHLNQFTHVVFSTFTAL